MPKLRVTSPARSQGDIATPKRKKSRGSRSLCSPALSTASGRLTSLVDQFRDKNMESFALSPLNGRSVLTDDTDIQEPRRKSWWKKLNENSQDVMEVLEDNKVMEANDIIEEFIDIEVLSQEKKNYTLDLPESSDNESINSIVLPQRKLFTQKDSQPEKKFGQLGGNRETLAKLHKTNTTNIDKTVNVGTRELFQNKRSKPVFPAALLSMSPNRTAADKTKDNLLAEPKPQVRSIFGNRPANKRKNMFADFIVSESEDEIPEIQPKVFGFQKKLEQRRVSSVSKGREHSPTSSITTDIEMDDWNMLPSSTMVDNQLEEMVAGHTPVKRARLSKLSEAKESELGTNTIQSNLTADKTKQSNKSISSKNKSKISPSKELETSRTTRSMTKNTSVNEEINTSTKSSKANKSKNKTANKDKLDVSNAEKSQRQNKSKTRNSSKIVDNDVITDEMDAPNVINNATRVINKSTSKKLSNSQVSNKSLKQLRKEDDYEEIVKDVSNEDDDENNITLEYEGDEMEEVVVQKQQMTNTENVDEIINKSNKNTTKTDINKCKSQVVNESNETLKQKQKASKVIEESVDSQQSMQDNVDGNLEQQDSEQNGNKESIGEVNEDLSSKANVSGKESDVSHENQENDQEGDGSHYDDDQVENDEQNDEEENESHEIEDENNVSNESDQEIDNDANESHEVEADESQVVEEENDQEDEDKANESREQEVEQDESHVEEHQESDEGEQEANESQEVDQSQVVEEENESNDEANQTVEAVESEEEVENEEAAVSEEEAEESAEEAAEIEEEPVESEEEAAESEEEPEEAEASAVEAEESAAEEADESIQADNNDSEVEEENQSQEVNESQEMDAEDNEAESDTNDQQVDGDESDEAASDPEMAEDSDQREMEVDENDQASNEAVAASEQNESEPLEENTGQSTEEIEESPNVTHDTTGRHRHKQVKSPEAILHDKTNQMDSFTVRGRNTSVRKTKSMIKNLDIRPSLAPRDSIGSEGTRNSSAEGSGWDSHRTTRKTLRQTFGKDFTPRKSLRAMVMEKSAKRQTELLDTHSVTAKFPQANSTEFAEDSNRDVADFELSDHEISKRTRQTTLELYLQKMKQQNIEKKLKMEEAVRNSLKAPVRDTLSLFKVPSKPAPRRPKPTQSKPKKQIKSVIAFDELPTEVIEDMKYKPPKRFQPTNASWITKRLYKFLENKLEPNYDYKARVRAEKLVETIYHFAKDLRRHDVAPSDAVDVLKHELARLEVVNTHFEFYEFFHEFMPREVRVKVVPDIVNKIPLPRHGVFSAILRGNTVQG
ncbi:interaptin-like [Trichoplusia ni]|uniref:Interaptin-like n=1 Tax=Trichoplusia ni TaxID=7111 RepID=A0A7E5VX85_TRINI|nr:interaptin-like [Trichoplusia ni]